MNTVRSRIPSIDYFRSIAVFAVILIHTHPFKENNSQFGAFLEVVINQGSRFAVPCFFVFSGYLWGKKIHAGTPVWVVFSSHGKRLLGILLFWSLLYIIVPTNLPAIMEHGLISLVTVPYDRLLGRLEDPIMLLFQGTKVHLWFLISLLLALFLSTVFIVLNMNRWLIPFAFALFIFGLIAGSYSVTPYGVLILFNTRNGPFLGTVFFVVGWVLSKDNRMLSFRLAFSLAIGGFFFQMTEAFILWYIFHIHPTSHDYLLGTLPFGCGVAMMALSRPFFWGETTLARLGTYTLGVYAIQYMFIDLLGPIEFLVKNYSWDIVFPFLVYMLSIITTSFLAKKRKLRGFVV